MGDITVSDEDLATSYHARHSAGKAALGKVSVLVVGASGVGKSTLINSAFGKEVARTGAGLPVTKSIQLFEDAESPLRIYDSRGLEISNSAETIGEVRRKIGDLRRCPDPRDQLHMAWLCILEASSRIEPVHKSMLSLLSELDIPTIVVVTQSVGDPKVFSEVEKHAMPNRGVVPVMAETKRIGRYTLEEYGVGDLIEKSLLLLPEAQRSAFVAAQIARWDLKEQAAIDAINSAAKKAALLALSPLPFGASAALTSLQIDLVAQINLAVGLDPNRGGGKALVSGFVGLTVASLGGKAAFAVALSQALKFLPGLGTAGAAVIGAPIAATVTKMFGHSYLETVKKYSRRDASPPTPEELAHEMSTQLAIHRERFDEQGRSK